TSSTASSAAPAQPASAQSASGSAAASRRYAPAPQRRQAAPQQAAAPAPVPMVTIPAGTELAIMINQSLGSDISSVDQPVVGQINRPVVVDGNVVIPRGARVNGRVTVATSSGHFRGRSELALRLVSLEFNGHSYPLSGSWSALGPSRGSRTAKVSGGGAGIGALVGALVGHGKGAAIGAAVGAGAGTADSALTHGKPVDQRPESVITVPLTASVAVHPANALLQ
ncbi:MAG: hypothetical protein ACRD13_14990, partial [Terriglobales bacterium]